MTVVDPTSLGWGDLVWSHFSRPRHGAFDERLDAAASAGYAGVGLYLGELRRLADEERIGPDEVEARLDDRGLCLVNLEALRGWWAEPGTPARAVSDADEALTVEFAQTVGVRNLQVIGPYDVERSVAVDRLGELGERLARHGLVASLEWLPFTNIATLAEGRAFVEECGAPNIGLCADIWHLRRGGDDEAGLAALTPVLISSIQLNDGTAVPVDDDYKADCLTNRLVPGDGDFDVEGFLRILRDVGVDCPFDLEVPSTALWAAPAAEAAQLVADATRTILARMEAER